MLWIVKKFIVRSRPLVAYFERARARDERLPMALSILRLLEYAVATGDALSILAKAFTGCFGYLQSQLPIEVFEPLRDEQGRWTAEEGGA